MENTIKLIILDREGKTHRLEAPTDMSLNLMEICRSYELPMKGTCGGMAMCATCQVYILSNHDLPEPSDEELAMLDQAFHVQPTSRLACQIFLSNDMDGLMAAIALEG